MSHSHGQGFSIELYAYHSKLNKVNTDFKLILSFCILLLSLILNHIYVSAFVIISLCMLNVYLGGMKLSSYLSVLMLPISFILLAGISIALEFSGKIPDFPYIKLWHIYIYTHPDRLYFMLNLSLKALACISAMYMLTLSSMPFEIVCALSRLKVPRLIIELMNLIYRFIFILSSLYNSMHIAASSRLGFHSLRASYKSFANIVSNILILAIKKSNDYYTAMEARCFDGDLQFLEAEKNIKRYEISLALLYITFMLLIALIYKDMGVFKNLF